MPRLFKSPRPLETNLAEFVIVCESYSPNVDIPLLLRAYQFAEAAHKGQTRASGAQFLEHSIAVATILAEQGVDTQTIVTGLLHDVVEDTRASLDVVRREFGEQVADLVDGVTKIGGLPEPTPRSVAENYRKMLIAIARDVRVIVIKLADRLHNMRTIEHLRSTDQLRIARETGEVYAPLAHRFGMMRIKWELEDHAFRILAPDDYARVRDLVRESRAERDEYIGRVVAEIDAKLKEAAIASAVSGRAKHFMSIWRKMSAGVPFSEIHDLVAFRVIVETIPECYASLGVIHANWRPVAERFNDYIATPKGNGYQSLHTTVVGPAGRLAEIQIRTREMHRAAEHGIAAHWRYKEGVPAAHGDSRVAWVRQVLEDHQDAEPEEFVADFKGDLFSEEVFVFTPAGDLIVLPAGSTPIDVAFAVHTEVGLSCVGARVNGRIVPLTGEVHTGDTVEIVTQSGHRPSRDWLSVVRTSRARSKIRSFLRKREHGANVALGREMLTRELSARRIPQLDFEDVAQSLGFPDAEAMMAAVGSGDLGAQRVVEKIAGTAQVEREGVLSRFVEFARGATPGVRVGPVSDLMFRFAQCCQPVPGEPIVGYVTRGRGVSIHRVDCEVVAAVFAAEEDKRKLELTWDSDPSSAFLVRLDALVDSRARHLLRDIAEAAAHAEAEVRDARIESFRDGTHALLAVEARNLRHLQRILRTVGKVKGVQRVDRARGGGTH